MPKTRAQKGSLLERYEEIVDKSNFAVVEVTNVPARVLVNLRKELSDVDAQFLIIKNKVFQKAVAKEDSAKDSSFVGPLAVIDGGNDIAAALKKLDTAIAEAKAALALTGTEDAVVKKYTPFVLKMGVINHSFLNEQDMVRLSQLPDRNTVLAQFVGTVAAPISGVMNVMNGVSRNLVYVLSDLQQKKAQAS